MYALRQIVFYLGPMTANEAAMHHGKVVGYSFTSNQIARHLSVRDDCISTMTREYGGSQKAVYELREPAANIRIVSMRRKVDRYIRDTLGLTDQDVLSMREHRS